MFSRQSGIRHTDYVSDSRLFRIPADRNLLALVFALALDAPLLLPGYHLNSNVQGQKIPIVTSNINELCHSLGSFACPGTVSQPSHEIKTLPDPSHRAGRLSATIARQHGDKRNLMINANPDLPYGVDAIAVHLGIRRRQAYSLRETGAIWTQVRRNQPDYMLSWMFSNGHVVASREMRRNGYPIGQYISVNWLNEVDLNNIGLAEATGILRGTNVAGGQNIPIVQEIAARLYDQGRGNGPRETLNDVYYDTGLAMYSSIFEGARLAYEAEGWPITRSRCAPACAASRTSTPTACSPRSPSPPRTTAAAAAPGSRCGTAPPGAPERLDGGLSGGDLGRGAAIFLAVHPGLMRH